MRLAGTEDEHAAITHIGIEILASLLQILFRISRVLQTDVAQT